MELTLEQAKELSEKKWQAITDNNGQDYGIEELIPELDGMKSNCAMCEYIIVNLEQRCDSCIYNNTACGICYSKWIERPNEYTARDVLNNIVESNKLNNIQQ